MSGLSSMSGRALDPTSDEYVLQSAVDILTTPIGSRVMLRDYGSWLPDLVDQPDNALTRIRLYGATALALLRWLRPARMTSVRLEAEGDARSLRIELERTDLPRPRSLGFSLPLARAGLMPLT